MFHWESRDIVGGFEKINEVWWVCVNCHKYGVEPDMLEGRVITANNQPVRLGKMAAKTRPESSYFRCWNIPDHLPQGVIKDRLRGLWLILDEKKRQKEIFGLRCELKKCAERERVTRPSDPAAPSLEGWYRWSLEPLDWVLTEQAAASDWPLPENQFTRVGYVDLHEVFLMFDEPMKRRQL